MDQKKIIQKKRKIERKFHSILWTILWIFAFVGLFIYPIIGLLALVCMIAPVVVSAFKGRYWCGWFCPRGSFYDHVISRFSRKKKIPDFIRTPWFRTIVFIFLMSMMTLQLLNSDGTLESIGFILIRLVVTTSILGIILGLLIHQRTWCTICPMGSLAALLGKGKEPLSISNACVSCKACTKNCPMQIEINEYKDESKISNPDCLKCLRCVEKCPKNAIDKINQPITGECVNSVSG